MSEDDSNGNKLRAAIEGNLAVTILRYATPILICIIGWFINDKLVDIEKQSADNGSAVIGLRSDMRDLNTRFDNQYATQIKANTADLLDIKSRRDDWTRWRAITDQRLDVIEGPPHRSVK